jgi:hypothetical protein
MLYQIIASDFVAGVVIDNIICVDAAPIIAWFKKHSLCFIQDYCTARKWNIRRVI